MGLQGIFGDPLWTNALQDLEIVAEFLGSRVAYLILAGNNWSSDLEPSKPFIFYLFFLVTCAMLRL